MHGRRRHDLADQLEQGFVPHPGDRTPAEVGSFAAGDLVVRLADGRGRERRRAPTPRTIRAPHAPLRPTRPPSCPPPSPAAGIVRRPAGVLQSARESPRHSATVAAMMLGVPVIAADAARRAGRRSEPPRFVEEVGAIDHRYAGDFQYFVGGGVAAFDCDDDGRSELFFAGGSEPAALYHNDSERGGALRFTPVPSPVTDLTAVTGAYPLDIDSDGHIDLVVLRVGEDVILRGLGDCRFERANEALGVDGGDTWTVAFSATWEGDNELPTLAFGDYLEADREGCEDSRLLRPETPATAVRPPIALSPGYCTLSVLFSDWNRSGQRDLRMTNDRHYYRDGTDQLWHVAHRRGAAAVHRGRRVAAAADLGHGHRQRRPHRRRLSRGVPDEPGRQQAADARRRAGPADVRGHRPRTRGHRAPPVHRRRRRCRRRRGTPSSPTSTTTASLDLFVAKGNVEAQDRVRHARSEQPADRPSRRHVRGRRRGRRDRQLPPCARRQRSSTSTSTGCSISSSSTASSRSRCGATSVPATATRRCRWATGSAVRLRQPAPNVDAVGAWLEVRVGGRTRVHEVTVGGGHAGGQLGWIHFGLGDADAAEVRVQWPDGEVGPWMALAAGEFAIIERGRPTATPGIQRRLMTTTATRRAVLADVELPDFGMPASEPLLPPSIYAERLERLRARMDARRYDHLVVWADREHSANLAYLTGFDPRFEEAVLIVVDERRSGAARRQRVLRRGRGGAAADALRPLPGSQPARPAPRRLVAAAGDPRRRGHHDRQPRRRRRMEDVRQPAH